MTPRMEQAPNLTPLEHIQTVLTDMIRDRLGEDFYVAEFPDDPKQFDGRSYPRLVLVQYSGSRYGAPEDGRRGTQARRAEFAIHLRLSSSGAPVRPLARIEILRKAVQGQRMEGSRVQILNDGLVEHDQDNGTWRYILEVALTVPALATSQNHITPAVMAGRRKGA
ncbi:Gp37 family protein [Epibacterium ulvae]|uniref:Gp37 family protein n=1 Tax=Epibacterium ulvae TaxID=1156985 RepID=UPI00248F67F7|nr:Gp37 family protein [Epibacterium ulvae]